MGSHVPSESRASMGTSQVLIHKHMNPEKQKELESHTWMQCMDITGLTAMCWNNFHNWAAVMGGWMKAL